MAVSNKLGMYLPTRDDYISVKRDISDNLAILDAAAGDMDIIINGNISSKNVTSGQFVTVLNSTITGVTDGIYKAVANVAAGVPFVAANLTAPTSGALNELVEQIALHGNAVELFRSVQAEGTKEVPNLSQFRYIVLYLGWDTGADIITTSSTCIVPIDLFKNDIVRAQCDMYDGSLRRYGMITYYNDTTLTLTNFMNLSGNWKLWAFGIK